MPTNQSKHLIKPLSEARHLSNQKPESLVAFSQSTENWKLKLDEQKKASTVVRIKLLEVKTTAMKTLRRSPI